MDPTREAPTSTCYSLNRSPLRSKQVHYLHVQKLWHEEQYPGYYRFYIIAPRIIQVKERKTLILLESKDI